MWFFFSWYVVMDPSSKSSECGSAIRYMEISSMSMNSASPEPANSLTPRQRSVSTPDLDDGYCSTVPRQRTTSSCQALRHALLTLYRLDDFIKKQLGNGFFSEVYQVKGKQLWVCIFLTRVATGFLPRDVLIAFFRVCVLGPLDIYYLWDWLIIFNRWRNVDGP